jgi:hypothetical protein
MYIVVGIIGIVLGVVGSHVARSLFFDPVSLIYTAADKRALNVLVRMYEEIFDLKPLRRIDSKRFGVSRALMQHNILLNYPSPENKMLLKGANGAIARKVRDPHAAAWKAVAYLWDNGFEAEILKVEDPDTLPGSMLFVSTNALPGNLLIFRKHRMKMTAEKKPPPKWTYDPEYSS